MTEPRNVRARSRVLVRPSTGTHMRVERKAHRIEPLPGWKPEAARPNSRAPLITVLVVGVLVVGVLGNLLLGFVTSQGVHFERARLKARTVAFARSLDLGHIKALTGQPADEGTPAFTALAARLREIRTANREVRFNYLMGWNGRAVVFLLDSTDPGSSDYSPPGEVYDEATPELVRSFTTGEPFVEGPVPDRWGTWVSGMVPIRDPSSGQIVAVMGMDIDATTWEATLAVSRGVAYLIIGFLLAVVVILARRVQALS